MFKVQRFSYCPSGVLTNGLRLDIEFALQDGSPSRIHTDEVPTPIISRKYSIGQQSESSCSDFDHFREVNPALLDPMSEIVNFTKILNNITEEHKLDPLNFSGTLVSLFHRLILFAPLINQRLSDPFEDLLHLALLAFLTTLLPEYGQDHYKYDLLSHRLRRAISMFVPTTDRHAEIMVWTLFVAGISVMRASHDQWLLQLVAVYCQQLNLRTWLDVRQILCKTCWIYAVHDRPGEQLWEEMGLAL
jgi:hypothetical protein